jgi:hypothetical protein
MHGQHTNSPLLLPLTLKDFMQLHLFGVDLAGAPACVSLQIGKMVRCVKYKTANDAGQVSKSWTT